MNTDKLETSVVTGTRWPVRRVVDLVNDLGGNTAKAAKRLEKPEPVVKMAPTYPDTPNSPSHRIPFYCWRTKPNWVDLLMLFDRQKRLLALLDALGGEVGNLDFQKLLFLYCREVEENPPYEFVPYKYGGFSFTSYADRRRLNEQGLLSNEERVWKLTPTGRDAASVAPSVRMKIDEFASRHVHLRGDALVAEAYRRFPFHAIRSEMATQVLAGDAAALKAIEEARPNTSSPGLCTIGYEGRSLEQYLNILLTNGVTVLCDVRRNPWSRKYGFSKGTLSKSCVGVGIRYEHLSELGIATEKRRGLDTQADYDALFAAYERENLPQHAKSIETIHDWLIAGERVALTCFERQPYQCHRHCIAELVETKNQPRSSTIHL